jgi:DNA-binding PadR family transcriptional regulator
MSVTRLLVLGAVRIFQPTHGYFVRRELASWQVAEWAHLNPGSIYNALRALTKDGLLIEEPADPADKADKTKYRLTVDGDTEFVRLVREGLWELHPYEPGWLLGGLSFWGVLNREEVLAALQARAALLTGRVSSLGFAAADMPETAAGTPDHVVEMFRIQEAHLTGELAWVQAVSERVRGGAYGFSGEDPARKMPGQDPSKPRKDR